MPMTIAGPCAIHHSHRPTSHLQDVHHVIPESWWTNGPAPGAPTLVVCPTGHRNIHYWIDRLVRGEHVPPTGQTELYYAHQAIDLAIAAGLKPAPTL